MKQILMMILFSTLLCWLMFAPIYKHVLIVRQAVLQKEVDYMLEIGANASHGYIDGAMINASKARLADVGLRQELINYAVETESGVSGTNPLAPVPRGTGLKLTITYPYDNLFVIDKLIGMNPPNPNERMGAAGMRMSEYVP